MAKSEPAADAGLPEKEKKEAAGKRKKTPTSINVPEMLDAEPPPKRETPQKLRAARPPEPEPAPEAVVSAGLSPSDVRGPVALLYSCGARAASVPPL